MFFVFLTVIGMTIKSLMNWNNSFEVALVAGALWVAVLVAGPIEASSQRNLRRVRFYSKETLLAGAFAAFWAAAVSAGIGALFLKTDSNVAIVAAGSGLVGLLLASIPYRVGFQ